MSIAISNAASTRAPNFIRLGVKLIGGFLAAILLLAAAGATYEATLSSGDATRYPPAGQLVDIGGYRLHLNCTGTGGPTIVLDAGLGGSSLDWSLVQSDLSSSATVCSYDRAGMGWSDPGPSPRNPARLAAELDTLLTTAGVPAPYVLVGHSLAGKTLRLFAAEDPDLVAGLVLVDARSETVDAALTPAEVDGFAASLRAQSQQYWIAGRLGLARLLGAAIIGEPSLSPDLATEMAILHTKPEAIAATEAEGLERSTDDDRLADASLGSTPLVVIAARDSLDHLPNWMEAQQGLAGLSTNSRLVVAPGSHAVPIEQPRLIVDAVREVIGASL